MRHPSTTLAAMLLLALAALCGCQGVQSDLTATPPDADTQPRPLSAVERALNFLAAQQNADGSWGEDPTNRPLLSALATLAYLSHYETPTSGPYRTNVARVVDFVLAEAGPTNAHSRLTTMAPDAKSATAWCLAEAYALTDAPHVSKALIATLPDWHPDGSTPFDLMAARSVHLSRVATNRPDQTAQIATNIVSRPMTTNLLEMSQWIMASLFVAEQRERGSAMAETLLASATNGWRTSDHPMLTAWSVSHTLFYSYARGFNGWWRSFGMETAKNQMIAGKTPDQGWWNSGDSFGITSSKECARFSPHDGRIYSTALLVFANIPFHGHGRLPVHRVEPDDVLPSTVEPDIKIIIR